MSCGRIVIKHTTWRTKVHDLKWWRQCPSLPERFNITKRLKCCPLCFTYKWTYTKQSNQWLGDSFQSIKVKGSFKFQRSLHHQDENKCMECNFPSSHYQKICNTAHFYNLILIIHHHKQRQLWHKCTHTKWIRSLSDLTFAFLVPSYI